jgi:universal stress protein E
MWPHFVSSCANPGPPRNQRSDAHDVLTVCRHLSINVSQLRTPRANPHTQESPEISEFCLEGTAITTGHFSATSNLYNKVSAVMLHADNGFKNTLVATDFSAFSNAALSQSVWLSRQTGARIVLANVIPDFSMSVHWGPHEREENQRELSIRSDTSMRRLIVDLEAVDLGVEFRTLIGEPFVEITRAVQAGCYDLVLAGTRGRATWERFFVGSTSKRLIRKCPSAVWIVKAEHVGQPKVVLACTDFSAVSFKAVTKGLWLAQQAGAEFHLLHVVDDKDVPEDIISRVPKGSSLRQEINDEAVRRMDEFLESLTVDRTQIQVHLSWGAPWQEICRVSQHQAADLIVIGTVGRSGIKGVLLGNTAEKVLDACECSVLTIKPDDFVSPIPSAA